MGQALEKDGALSTNDMKAGQSTPADIGFIYTIAGTGVAGYNGDGGPALDAKVYFPMGVAVDGDDNVYIADQYNYRVRRVDQFGDITTIAGTGEAGFNGDGQATSAKISPVKVAIAESGEIFVADFGNHRVRMIRRNGTITTIAGTGTAGYDGDGGQASAARLNEPQGIAVDKDKNVYIADSGNHRVRKVRSTDRMISTVAGTGTPGFSGDGHRAAQAQLNYPDGLALDAAGNLYIADARNNRIRRVDLKGNINTIVGTGVAGYNGDGQATSTQLDYPFGIAVDFAGNLFIADLNNQRIRKVLPGGKVSTVAGNGVAGYGGDDDEAIDAQLKNPAMVCVDSKGNVYVADSNNHRVRKIIGVASAPPKPKK